MTRETREACEHYGTRRKSAGLLRNNSARARSDSLTGIKACSLRSKRFLETRSKEKPRNDEKRDFQFWPREKWNENRKMSHFLHGLWLLFPVLCSETARKHLLRRLIRCTALLSRSARRRFAPLQKSRGLNFIRLLRVIFYDSNSG